MTRYRKKPVPIKIEPVDEARTIKTLEGSQRIEPGQYLATGTKGEQWAFERDVFDTYEPVPDRPGYYTKRGDVTVEAVRLAHPVEVKRPGWKHAGKPGDWLVTRAEDDQYVVEAGVFAETYEPVETPEGG
jgi:hypothetical protein